MKKIRGYISALASAILFGCGAIMISAAMARGTKAATVCILRGITFIVSLIVPIKNNHFSLRLTKKQYFHMIPVLGAAAMTNAVLNLAYVYLPTGVASSIHFVYPVIVAAAEAILFRSHINKTIIPFLAVSTIGIILQADLCEAVSVSGIAIALLSSLFWSCYILCFDHSNLRKIHPFVLNFYQGIMLIIIGSLWLLVEGDSFTVPDVACLILIVGDGVIAGVVAHILLQAGIAVLGGPQVAVMSVMEPATSLGLSALFLRQFLSVRQWSACIVILGSSLGLIVMETLRTIRQANAVHLINRKGS